MSTPRRGTIRIVAGSLRGRRIEVPGEKVTRPTSELVREAVFDALGPVSGLTVLDLFAGSGALGLEALSRGAGRCVFVETDPGVAKILRRNISVLGREQDCSLIIADYRQALRNLVRTRKTFDLLFVDPPYRMLAEVEEVLAPLLTKLLSGDGLAVVEGPTERRVTLAQSVAYERDYGDTRITMVEVRRSDW